MKKLANFLPPGYCLERYCFESILGSGGFGVTYKAGHKTLPIYYAIKEYLPVEWSQRDGDSLFVHPNSLGQELFRPYELSCYEWGLQRFLLEANTLAEIDHPNVVRVVDFFEANGTAYIVMAYEEGEPLNAVLARESTLPEDKLRPLLGQTLSALEAVHATDYLHRDIKPHNLYLRRDGSVMLIDFGAARQRVSSLTKTIISPVSPPYSPPEQYIAGNDYPYGPWTDIYALGAVAYQCITGRKPPEAPCRLMGKDLEPAVKAGAGRYPRALLAAVDRALAVEPVDRFQTAAEMRAALLGKAISPPSLPLKRSSHPLKRWDERALIKVQRLFRALSDQRW